MLTTFAIVNQRLFHIFDRLIIVLSTLISINYYILQIINFWEKNISYTFHPTLQEILTIHLYSVVVVTKI